MSLKNFMSYDDAATVLGEYADKVNELKSGLTNVDVALSVPDGTGKNVLPLTLDRLKALNSSGSWNNNVYTYKSLTYTVEINNEGYITSIKVNGTADSQAVLVLFNGDIGTGSYTLNGITGGSGSTYLFYAPSAFGEVYSEKTANVSGSFELDLYVRSGVTLENQMFYPMIRPATITDPTFTPYIPSVDARLDAVESGLTNVENKLKGSIWTYASTDNDYIAIEASPGARYIVLLNTMGSNGINGFNTVIFSINAGYNPSNFNTVDIITANNFVKEVSYDNYRYIIKEKNVSEDAYGTYLKALVIKTLG